MDTVLNFILSLNVNLLLFLILLIVILFTGATAISHIELDKKLTNIEKLLEGK